MRDEPIVRMDALNDTEEVGGPPSEASKEVEIDGTVEDPEIHDPEVHVVYEDGDVTSEKLKFFGPEDARNKFGGWLNDIDPGSEEVVEVGTDCEVVEKTLLNGLVV